MLWLPVVNIGSVLAAFAMAIGGIGCYDSFKQPVWSDEVRFAGLYAGNRRATAGPRVRQHLQSALVVLGIIQTHILRSNQSSSLSSELLLTDGTGVEGVQESF